MHASMPPPYWAEALSVDTYLLKRCLSSSISSDIPYTCLHGRQPSYDPLRVFGCLCYPNLQATSPPHNLLLGPLHVFSWAILRHIKDIVVFICRHVMLSSLAMLCLMNFLFPSHVMFLSQLLHSIFYEMMIWILLFLALLTMQQLPRRSLHPPWM